MGYSKFILNGAPTFEVNMGKNARFFNFSIEDGRGLESVRKRVVEYFVEKEEDRSNRMDRSLNRLVIIFLRVKER